MTYQQTLDHLYSQLPMFHRIGSAAYKANLDNTIAICKLLGNPENKFRSVHIAGTNGKGSSSHMIASVLQAAGYKTGLYTSPHLKDFRERIRINGKMIPKKNVVAFVARHKKDFERIKPSFFEMTVGLAFDHFANEKVDIAVIEVGLGGRLDSTNVITPLVSLITNISLDHQQLLGDTIEKITAEKAGIIKSAVPVVIGETQKQSEKIFKKKAQQMRAPLYFADKHYKAAKLRTAGHRLVMDVSHEGNIIYKDLESELAGNYQAKNIPAVLMTLDLLKSKKLKISAAAVRLGLTNTVKRTGLLGRWQVLSQKPLTVADTGHNEAGIKEVLRQVKLTPHAKLHFVFGAVNDKDIAKILNLLPRNATYYFCRALIPRALDEKLLAGAAKKAGLKGKHFSSVKLALAAAQRVATAKDLVLVGGSTFVVAEVV